MCGEILNAIPPAVFIRFRSHFMRTLLPMAIQAIMVRAPGRATYIIMPPCNGFETRHGLMPKKCLNLYPVEDYGS